jgi:hypothetical protein
VILTVTHHGDSKRNPVISACDSEYGGEVTEWTRQPEVGWTTLMGWPADPEFAHQLDAALAEDEEPAPVVTDGATAFRSGALEVPNTKRNGTRRTCRRCAQAQVKTKGRWQVVDTGRNQGPHTHSWSYAGQRGPKRNAERDQRVADLYRSGASMVEVARATGLSPEGVRLALRAQAIPTRPVGRPRSK